MSTTCSFEVRVLTEAAVLTLDCPDNLTVNASVGATGALVEWVEPIANSNCSLGATSSEQITGLDNGSEFPVGITTVTYAANDACENAQNCSFDVTVTQDELVVTLECPSINSVQAPIGATGVIVEWDEPIGSTNCELGTSELLQTTGLSNGSFFPVGTTLVEYIFTTGCESNETCSFEVIVLGTEATLEYTCPENIVVDALVGATTAVVEWDEPQVSTNCFLGGENFEQISGGANGSEFPVGTTTVTYAITDNCDNEASCIINITVDQEELVVELTCPENMTLAAPVGADGMIVDWELPEGNTNCEIAQAELIQTSGPENGSFLPLGETMIEYTYNSGCGENLTCSFIITVNSQDAVLNFSCPENILIDALVGAAGVQVNWDEPIATSNCIIGTTGAMQVDGLANGSIFPQGTNIVTYEAGDGCNNSITCSFSVIVTQDELMVNLECPEDIIIQVPTGETGMNVNWPDPIADSNCEIAASVLTQTSGCLLYTSPSPRDQRGSRMPSSA